MPTALNRTLQMRAADRVRAVLARDEVNGLLAIGELAELDQRELCDVGGGRLAAIAIRVAMALSDGHTSGAETSVQASAVPGDEPGDERNDRLEALVMRAVGELVGSQVRRTDLVGALDRETLVVLVPGLEPVNGRYLVDRLQAQLARRQLVIERVPVELNAGVAASYRSAASPGGWTIASLAAEAATSAAQHAGAGRRHAATVAAGDTPQLKVAS